MADVEISSRLNPIGEIVITRKDGTNVSVTNISRLHKSINRNREERISKLEEENKSLREEIQTIKKTLEFYSLTGGEEVL